MRWWLMNDLIIIKISFIVIVISLFVLLLSAVKYKQLKGKRSNKKSIHKEKALLSIYMFLMKIPIINKSLRLLKEDMARLDLTDQRSLKIKTTTLYLIGFMMNGSLVVILWVMIDVSYTFAFIILVLYLMNEEIRLHYFSKKEVDLLIQFEAFLSKVKHHYHRHHMIDEAIYDATLEVNRESFKMSLHGKKMIEVLQSVDEKSALEGYYDRAPNKYFKNFMGLCHLVKRFGDRYHHDQSVFLSNINYLKEEIKYELLRKNRLKYLFRSLAFITIVPVFFMSFFQNWAMANLPELEYLFHGVYGFIVDSMMLFIIFMTSHFLRRMKRHQRKSGRLRNKVFKNVLKIGFLRERLLSLMNRKYTKVLKIKRLLKSAAYPGSIEAFYLTRFFSFLLALILLTGMFFYGLDLKRGQIMANISEIYHDQVFKNLDVNERDIKLEKAVLKDIAPHEKKQVLSKIKETVNAYNQMHFKWWHLLIILCLSTTAYNIPFLLLIFKRKIRLMAVEDEVIQMHTIIMMLMYFKRVSVYDVLLWMEQFSDIFKKSIQQCIDDYDENEIEALNTLKAMESQSAFKRIVDNLINASERVSLEVAFDALMMEKKYYSDKRKESNKEIIEKKGMIGRLIAFIPMGLSVILYLLIPFLIFSIQSLLHYSDQIKSVL